ncbi:MAG: cupredoxin domain-containing protein, partial [Nitrosotalea sp.]
ANMWSTIGPPMDFHEYFSNGTKIFPNGTKGTWVPRLHKDQIVTVLSNHKNPQAGITVTHDSVKFLASTENNSFQLGPTITITLDPLEQFKSGIASKDVACKKGLDLLIRTEDGSPACVRYTTADLLINRGWAREAVSTMTSLAPTVIIPVNSSLISNGFTFVPAVVKTLIGINNTVRWINMDSDANDITSDTGSFSSGVIEPGYAWMHIFDKAGTYGYHSVIHPWLKGTIIVTANPLASLENDTGTVTFGNQTYYFETPNYTNDAYFHPVQVSFHDVVFTLFPSGFKGGLPTSCGETYYWTDVRFSDNASELLHIFAGPKCPVLPPPTSFSNHANPQAGLTFYDGKMKLLVSTSTANSIGSWK